MTTKEIVTTEIKGNDLILSRLFNAPRSLVFKVWTSKEHLEKWWGPHFITKNKIEIDLRIGGKYKFVMCGPNGEEYPMRGVFTEVVKDERISYSINLDGHPKEWFDMMFKKLDPSTKTLDSKHTIIFEEIGKRTKVSVIAHFNSPDVLNAFKGLGMIEGWSQSLKKLEVELTK